LESKEVRKPDPHHKFAEEARNRGFIVLGLYRGSKKKIRVRCLASNEIHYVFAGPILRGAGLRCCGIAKQKQAKLIPGNNDLATRFPEVAREAYGWDPSSVFPGTSEIKK